MAGRSASQEDEDGEPMVPVFTVIKNGAILKNIFVINNGALSLEEEEEVRRPFDLMDDVEGQEEVLIVGRHPDCDIMLTQPSISRFHLKILSNPTARKLSVMDLSSVHGTWISDSRIDPGVLVELNEGDTIRVGGSSRVYRLHWVLESHAYDCENPFISALDLAVIGEEEEENEATEDAVLGEAHQDDYFGVVESAQATETKNAFVAVEDEEISQVTKKANKDFSASKGITNNSTRLTLEDSIASLALHDIENAESSTEFLTPVKGELSVDQFQMDSRTRRDNPDDTNAYDQIRNEEQSKEGILESESLRGSLATESCEGNENAFLVNQWTDSLSRFSPTLEAIPSETRNPQSGEPDITSLTCMAAAETAEVGDNEKHSDWSQSLSRFSPSVEALARSLSPITPIEIGSLHSGKREVTWLPQTAFEPLILKENCNHSTKWTSHPILSGLSACETEDSSTAADTIIIGCKRNHSGNQSGDLRDHIRGHSRTSQKIAATDNNVLAEVTHQHFNEENNNPEPSSVKRQLFSDREKESINLKSSAPKSNIWLRRGKPAAVLQLQTGKARSKAKRAPLDQQKNEKQHQDKKEIDTITCNCSANSCEDEEEIFTPDKENITPKTRLLRSMHKVGKKESGEEKGEEEIFTPDKENMTPNTRLLKSWHKIGKKKSEGGGGEEVFAPDKENMTPNTRPLKSWNKISKMKSVEVMHSNSIGRSSPPKLSCLGHLTADCNILSLEKEGKTLDVPWKQGTPELQSAYHPLSEITGTGTRSARTPFQSLQVSFHSHHASTSLHATKERNSSIYEKQSRRKTFSDTCPDNNDVDGQRMNWTMVVDITSFLDKESRKSLQLLRGLKGTQLIIPRMVMRELEQRSSLFRRATDISSLLEWIEVCMVTTPWWIHIQTKLEEESSIAPTPLASPCFAEISVWGNQCEVDSPTAEGHILEYAISLAKIQVDRCIVLISNDVTLKIKAMAEGMKCETAQEFRASLVNPFSDRFMWRNSSARGQTWSGAQDEVLREIIYQRQPSKKTQSRGEGARGLKLILLHNSQYGKQISLN